MQAEFERRFPTFVRHATANVPVCAGPNDATAQHAAQEIMCARLTAQQIAAVGTPGNVQSVLRTRATDMGGRLSPLQVTMDDTLTTLRLLRMPACVRIDGVGFSMEDIARVVMQPDVLPMLSTAGVRTTGPTVRWTLDMLGCVRDFAQPLADELMCAPEQRERTLADVLAALQRFAAWLVTVPLLPLTSVLTTWLGASAVPTPTPEEAARLVDEAPAAEWRRHATLLADWYVQQLNNAVPALCDVKAAEGMDPIAVARLGEAMHELIEAYVHMRFVTAHLLFRAAHAFNNYLTCSARVAYAGVVPAAALLGTRASADPSGSQYEALPTPEGNAAPCTRSAVASAGLLLRRMEQLPVVDGVRKAQAQTFGSIENTMLALFAAVMWRWVYIGHLVPMLLKTRRSSDRLCTTLDLFALPNTPCNAVIGADATPIMQATLRSYLSVAWVATSSEGGRVSTMRVELPHAAHPEMPTGIRARAAPDALVAAAAAPPARKSSIANRYNRRQKSLIAVCTEPPAKPSAPRRIALKKSAWTDAAVAASVAIPRNRARVKVAALHKVAALPSIPLAPVGTTAPMPAARHPSQMGAAKPCQALYDSVCHVALEQTEPSAMLELVGEQRAPESFVRARELVALIVYWFNQCQDVHCGLYVGVDLRSVLANRVGEAAEARHRNARTLCLRTNSPLLPLAARMHAERKRHRDTDITTMLFDHRPGNAALHNN